MTLSTVGYGDFSPISDLEKLTAIVNMIIVIINRVSYN